MKSTTLKIIIVLFAGIFLLAAVNFPYIKSNIRFFLNPPQKGGTQPLTIKFRPRGEPLPTTTPNTLIIDSLGISLPLVYVTEKSEKAYQAALQNGVAHYPETAKPGDWGNCYIFGHSSDLVWNKGGYKTAFAALPKIKIGDSVKISDREGVQYRYKVVLTKVVEPDDLSVLSQGEYKKKLLTLQTSYPLGTALRRFIAVAELEF